MAQEIDILSVPDTNEIEDKEFLVNDLQGNPSKVPWSLVRSSIFIHTKKNSASESPYDFNTIIEGISEKDLEMMSDSSKYRICLLRFRKQKQDGPRWRILMLPYEIAKRTGKSLNTSILEEDTWWPITGKIVPWFRNGRNLSQVMSLNVTKALDKRKRFCATRNIKMNVGVAIFKNTGYSGEGWTRISNISYITLYVQNNGGIRVKMNCD